MKRSFIFIMIAFSSLPLMGQGIDFYREDITFRLSKEYFYVEGIYWFRNNSADYFAGGIYFPFADSSAPLSVDSLELFNITTGEKPALDKGNGQGFFFTAIAAAGSETLYRIKYRVRIMADSVYYILISTQAWNKPLEFAEYKLIVEKGEEPVSFSYNPDKTYDIGGQTIFYWRREAFMPDKDFVFHLPK